MSGPVLITGAEGFVGGHLRALLTTEGLPIVAWRRPRSDVPPHRAPTPASEHVTWLSVDVLDRRAVLDGIATLRPAVIYHCAGAAHVGSSWDRVAATFEINALGTHHVIEAMRVSGLDARLLIPGSALIYRPSSEAIPEDHPLGPSSPYGLSKLVQELLGARAAGTDDLAVLLARAFTHVGPGQDASYAASGFAQQIARIEAGHAEPVIRTGNLAARRDLTDVRDTVRAYRLVMDRGQPGRAYNVCSGRAYPISDVLDTLLAHAQAEIRIESDPSRYRPNDTPVLLGDPGRLRDELGWTPSIPLERTLADLLTYWRARVRTGC